MVIIKCSNCKHVIETKSGYDCDTAGMTCPKCGHNEQDIDIN